MQRSAALSRYFNHPVVPETTGILISRHFEIFSKARISLTCLFNTRLSFDEVHDFVTILESRIYLHLKNLYSNLSNVIIHAEPLKKAE